MYLQLGEINSRNEFGDLLRNRGLIGNAVEIGTHRGDFAVELLQRWPGELLCVDPWNIPPGYEYQASFLWGGESREQDFQETQRKLAPFGPRVAMLATVSDQAVHMMPDGTFDFVFVDGDHSYEAVSFDLRHWWPKVAPGGIIAGHDIIMPGEPDGGWAPGIQKAVHEFATDYNLIVYLVIEAGGLPWSYYIVKGRTE